jgi:hypothetical protein
MIFSRFFEVQGDDLLDPKGRLREVVELGQSWDRVARMIGPILSDV